MKKKRKKIWIYKIFNWRLMMFKGYHSLKERRKRKIEKQIKLLKLIMKH
jgi:hypothetical protein